MNSPEIPKNKNDQDRDLELRVFIEEVSRIKEEDRTRGWPVHLSDVNPEELTYDDALMYRFARDKAITREALGEYESKIVNPQTGELRENVLPSRLRFLEFIRNLAMVIFVQKESARRRSKERQ